MSDTIAHVAEASPTAHGGSGQPGSFIPGGQSAFAVHCFGAFLPGSASEVESVAEGAPGDVSSAFDRLAATIRLTISDAAITAPALPFKSLPDRIFASS